MFFPSFSFGFCAMQYARGGTVFATGFLSNTSFLHIPPSHSKKSTKAKKNPGSFIVHSLDSPLDKRTLLFPDQGSKKVVYSDCWTDRQIRLTDRQTDRQD